VGERLDRRRGAVLVEVSGQPAVVLVALRGREVVARELVVVDHGLVVAADILLAERRGRRTPIRRSPAAVARRRSPRDRGRGTRRAPRRPVPTASAARS